MTKRLANATLEDLPTDVARPAYDSSVVKRGIVHLGLGAFHRAHQAVFLDDCLGAGDMDWGIVGASLRNPDTRDALEPQDHLYTLLVRDGSGERARVIGSVLSCLVAPENPTALLDALGDPNVRIVTLTVTEKAYLRNAAGDLDAAHPDVVWDLANPAAPRTVHGFLAESIARRRDVGTAPFTVLSCDNLPSNGATLRRLLVAFAKLRDRELARFIETGIAFPSSMVDRIVPATTDADRKRAVELTGVTDAWPIATEPFLQWVIEDNFPSGRPDWEPFGVEMVSDVRPFEEMKLRLLNGAHSGIAYLGLLAGHETVADSFGDPAIKRFVQGLWAEAIPTLPTDAGLRPYAYIEALSARFDNPAIRHRTAQIANDGSQKLPQRIIATALERQNMGLERPMPAYREMITLRHTGDYTHKRLLRGSGEFARVRIEFEPNGVEPFIFESRTSPAALPQVYVDAVQRGIRSIVDCGPLAGFPIVGLKAILVDGAYHQTDSTEHTFEVAGRDCLKDAIPSLGLELLEPPSNPPDAAPAAAINHLMLVPAAWIAACEQRGGSLAAGLFADPLDPALSKIFAGGGSAKATVEAVFDVTGFAVGHRSRAVLVERAARHLDLLRSGGVAAALNSLRGPLA